MIDTLLQNQFRFVQPDFWKNHQLAHKKYLVMTLHRPGNVDNPDNFRELITEIISNSDGVDIVFPIHPRTKQILEGLHLDFPNLIQVDPLPYLEFNYLVKHSMGVITDSGGISEETTVLGIPCITLRSSTERPETVTIGTNELIGSDKKAISKSMKRLLSGQWKKGQIPPFWDGKAGERIIKIILEKLC